MQNLKVHESSSSKKHFERKGTKSQKKKKSNKSKKSSGKSRRKRPDGDGYLDSGGRERKVNFLEPDD